MMDDKALKTYADFIIHQNEERAKTPEPPFLKTLRNFAAGKHGQNFLIVAAITAMTYLTFREQINEAVISVGATIGETIDKVDQRLYDAVAKADNMIPRPVPR